MAAQRAGTGKRRPEEGLRQVFVNRGRGEGLGVGKNTGRTQPVLTACMFKGGVAALRKAPWARGRGHEDGRQCRWLRHRQSQVPGSTAEPRLQLHALLPSTGLARAIPADDLVE